jgi:hypothetical protein
VFFRCHPEVSEAAEGSRKRVPIKRCLKHSNVVRECHHAQAEATLDREPLPRFFGFAIAHLRMTKEETPAALKRIAENAIGK